MIAHGGASVPCAMRLTGRTATRLSGFNSEPVRMVGRCRTVKVPIWHACPMRRPVCARCPVPPANPSPDDLEQAREALLPNMPDCYLCADGGGPGSCPYCDAQ